MSARYEESIEIARQLIQFDTSNDGRDVIETPAAEYVMDLLSEVGLQPEMTGPTPGRPSVVVRIPGKKREVEVDPVTGERRGAVVIHGHLDVVPAVAEDWSVDPFAAVIKDGMLWGRGAVDMKNMDAMILTVVREIARTGYVPPRDLIIAMFADEEAGGKLGAHWMVDNRPDVFEGATHAISEVGGYSTYVAGKRVYLLQTGEKSLTWYKFIAEGTAGHGSQVNNNNAVAKLANVMDAIGKEEWPLTLTDTVTELLAGVSELSGLPFDPDDEETLNALVDALGPAKAYVGATLRTGANLTSVNGGYMANVIPQTATGTVDVRAIPGTESEVAARIDELAASVRREQLHHSPGFEAPTTGSFVDAMTGALQELDPEASVLPYLLSAGTDNKTLGRLGIQGYGFSPVRLPEGFDFPAMFHGVDERVPVDSLPFGTAVLRNFIERL
ncbi:M20/M25/M40 family metallo-hydrolase [Trueperella bialowiezensis]|uniref:Acetylornithine deacetylase n=1 Tax=Trueperella bialowiezensis TaxID=312285 RepID=A0A448PBK7_9ACTO|nr:M20/M25/M40 family metallo-hydrolase [Trueperella bialowiezensis]VEI12369.1 Acetylornithine deacetylase [Trueperella bialowiezensis]